MASRGKLQLQQLGSQGFSRFEYSESIKEIKEIKEIPKSLYSQQSSMIDLVDDSGDSDEIIVRKKVVNKVKKKVILDDEEEEDENDWIQCKNKINTVPIRKKVIKKKVVYISSDDEEEEDFDEYMDNFGKANDLFGKKSLLSRSLLENTPDESKRHDALHRQRLTANSTARNMRAEKLSKLRNDIPPPVNKGSKSSKGPNFESIKLKSLDDDYDEENEFDYDSDEVGKNSRKGTKSKVKSSKAVKTKKRRLDSDDSDDDSEHSDDESDDDSDDSDDSESKGDSDDDNSNADSVDWRGSELDIKERAKRILDHCSSVSQNLRNSLKKWAGAADDSKDCIDLVSIARSGSGVDTVLKDDDFATVCPSLKLKAYQLVGVNWIRLLDQNDINGVLADDMGLGKTVQTIAFLGWLKSQKTVALPHLIVVPASTLSNWQIELSRFCPSLNVQTYHGSQYERLDLRPQIRSMIRQGEVDVVLCTYTIFERESSKDDRSFIYHINFNYLILDEAHSMKNRASLRYCNLSNCVSKHRLLLSGTPVQNNLSELLALLSFLMPTVFGKQNSEILLEAFEWENNEKNARKGAVSGGLSLTQLRGMLAPFVLRRKKCDVLDQLSDKFTELVKVAMVPSQKGIYEQILRGYAKRKENKKIKDEQEKKAMRHLEGVVKGKKSAAIVDLTTDAMDLENGVVLIEGTSSIDLVSDSEAGKGSNALSTKEVNSIVRDLSASEARHLFTALRKAANHPLLLRYRYTDQKQLDKIAEVTYYKGHFGHQCDLQRVKSEIELFSDYDLHQICMEYSENLGDFILPLEALFDSPKMVYLSTMIPTLLSQGHRILLFSQWTRLLDLLEVLMNHLEIKFLRLDGSTPVKVRQEMIDTFNNELTINVFLLSTKAGGLGINLTAADTVIMHDLDFNPENDRQAEDRCHRIGQTKQVTVYKLVTEGSVDEDILDMGERKSALTKAVLENDAKGDSAKKEKKSTENDEGDIKSIQKILQKALASISR
jgi:SWI/SNF-related matrix-associated actin-dependent regulator 1 of chromatin subfamily A